MLLGFHLKNRPGRRDAPLSTSLDASVNPTTQLPQVQRNHVKVTSRNLEKHYKLMSQLFKTVPKRLKVLEMIQKQEHWVPYELKPRDAERRVVTCELLLQW